MEGINSLESPSFETLSFCEDIYDNCAQKGITSNEKAQGSSKVSGGSKSDKNRTFPLYKKLLFRLLVLVEIWGKTD